MKDNTVGDSVVLGGVAFQTDGTSAWRRRFGKGAGPAACWVAECWLVGVPVEDRLVLKLCFPIEIRPHIGPLTLERLRLLPEFFHFLMQRLAASAYPGKQKWCKTRTYSPDILESDLQLR
jgi:hypothetical protein